MEIRGEIRYKDRVGVKDREIERQIDKEMKKYR